MVKNQGRVILESKVCLKGLADSRSNSMVRLFGQYQDKHLPFAGGTLEQPNYYLQAMNLIRGLIDG